MGIPIATPSDLGTYLGDPSIDTARATQILALAQTKCERYVSPITVDALDVVLDVAARAYTNATQAHSMSLGSGSVSYGAAGTNIGIGGLVLTRANIRDLRLSAGRSGAFAVDLLPRGASEVQTLVVTASAGTYTLTFSTASAPIAWNAPLLTLQAALQAVPSVGANNLLVTGTVGTYTLTFAGSLATTPLPLIVVDSTLLTGTAVIARAVGGAFVPGQNMPWWDWTP